MSDIRNTLRRRRTGAEVYRLKPGAPGGSAFYAKGRPRVEGYLGQVCYYPDPRTFVEDNERRMAYYRREQPLLDHLILERKLVEHTFKYRDGQRVRCSSGRAKWAMFYRDRRS
jgi:hypothetical protein